MELNDTICYCFHVTKRKIVNFIRVEKPRRASQLAECGSAGTGCGWCVPFLKRCFEQAAARGEAGTEELSPVEYARQRAAYIRSGQGKAAPGAIPLPDDQESADVPDAVP